MRRISPRQLRRMTKRLGVEMEELEGVVEVIIHTEDKDIIIENPQVLVMSISGQKVYQIMGEEKEVERKEEEKEEALEISEEDVQLVASQAGVSLEEARKALEATKGDLAAAIMLLKGN
ncbi:MAG: nascent polypeptide-associated complex protein [Thermoprotei archaeon]|nr:nascent polypeptide-associated complex protein [Thermoprotei archaeon]